MHLKTEQTKRHWARGLIALALAVLAAAALIHLAGVRTWPFELVHHFIPQYLLAATGLAVLALLVRAWCHAAAAGGLASVFAAICLLAPIDPPDGPSDSAGSGSLPAPPPARVGTRRGVQRAVHRSFTLITNNVFVLNRPPRRAAGLAVEPAGRRRRPAGGQRPAERAAARRAATATPIG